MVRNVDHVLAGLREFNDVAADIILEIVQKLSEERQSSLLFCHSREMTLKGVKSCVKLSRVLIFHLAGLFELAHYFRFKTSSVLDKGQSPIPEVRPIFLWISLESRGLFVNVSVPSLPTGCVYIAKCPKDLGPIVIVTL